MKLAQVFVCLAVLLVAVQVHSLSTAQFALFKDSELAKARLQACQTTLDHQVHKTKFGAMSPDDLVEHLRKRF